MKNYSFSDEEEMNELRMQIFDELAVNLADNDFRSIQNLPSLAVITNDENATLSEIDAYNWRPDNPCFLNVWKNIYKAISNLNSIIAGLQNRGIVNYEMAHKLYLEARFLRAFYYFELKVMFGNIPVITEEIKDVTKIDAIQVSGIGNDIEFWDTMFEDLNKALELEQSKITGNIAQHNISGSWAVKTLLGKVYLYRSSKDIADEWLLAFKQFNEVINSGRFILEKNYANLFEADNTKGIETILDSRFLIMLSQKNDLSQQSDFLLPSTSFLNLFDANDSRKDALFKTESNGILIYKKYNSEINTFGISTVYMSRLADIWLMQAECLNHISSQDRSRLTGINLVRERSGQEVLDNNLNTEEFLSVLQIEKEKELVLESKTLFDYRRWGLPFIQKQFPNLQIEEKHLLFPIPTVILNDKLFSSWNIKQNTGY